MRKKKVIVAFIAFLVCVCGVMILNTKNYYSAEVVKAQIAKHGDYFEKQISYGSYVVSVRETGLHFSVFQRVIDCYQSYHAKHQLTATNFMYSRTGSDYYFMITLYENNNQIHKVEIESDIEFMQDALDIQSVLSKAFPNLPCKITASQ